MRKLRSRFFAFFVAICMVTPLLCQPALALDSSGEELPGGFVSVSELGVDSFSIEPADTEPDSSDANIPTPYALSEGCKVLQITVYPLAINLDTNEIFIHTGIYDRITYSTMYQASAGFALSPSQTINLMQRMLNALGSSSSTQNCQLVGWHVETQINFNFERPEYIVYRYKTSTAVSDDIRQDGITSGTYTFSKGFGYPTLDNINFLEDYYYVGFQGAFYATSSNGLSLGNAFGAVVSFNCDYPTRPD